MNKKDAIRILSFDIESAIFDCKKDDMRMDKISEHTQQKIDAWNYVKENLK